MVMGGQILLLRNEKTSYTSSDKWKLYLACSNGVAFQPNNEGYLNNNFQGFTVVDVDGDGKDELLWKDVVSSTYQM